MHGFSEKVHILRSETERPMDQQTKGRMDHLIEMLDVVSLVNLFWHLFARFARFPMFFLQKRDRRMDRPTDTLIEMPGRI